MTKKTSLTYGLALATPLIFSQIASPVFAQGQSVTWPVTIYQGYLQAAMRNLRNDCGISLSERSRTIACLKSFSQAVLTGSDYARINFSSNFELSSAATIYNKCTAPFKRPIRGNLEDALYDVTARASTCIRAIHAEEFGSSMSMGPIDLRQYDRLDPKVPKDRTIRMLIEFNNVRQALNNLDPNGPAFKKSSIMDETPAEQQEREKPKPPMA